MKIIFKSKNVFHIGKEVVGEVLSYNRVANVIKVVWETGAPQGTVIEYINKEQIVKLLEG